MPRTLSRLGLTGTTRPPNEAPVRFCSSVLPTLPGVSVAPMSATERGLKNGSSGCLSCRRMSCANVIWNHAFAYSARNRPCCATGAQGGGAQTGRRRCEPGWLLRRRKQQGHQRLGVIAEEPSIGDRTRDLSLELLDQM